MRKFFLLVFLLTGFALQAQTGKEPIRVTDLLQIKSAGSIALSPDGKWVAFTVTQIDAEDSKWEYGYSTQIWLAPTDGSADPRPLTTSKTGGSQPSWRPDGKALAFVRTAEGRPQLFLLSLDGGEPTQLTDFKYGASAPRWSDDGRQLLFSSTISLQDLLTDSLFNPGQELPKWADEKPGFLHNRDLQRNKARPNPDGNLDEVRAYLSLNEKDRKAKVITKLNFQQESSTSSTVSFRHVLLTNASPGSTPIALTTGFHSYGNPQFIAGSNRILLESNYSDAEHPDRVLETQLFTVNTDGSQLKPLLGKPGYSFFGSVISPNGRQIALLGSPVQQVGIPELMLLPASGNEKEKISIPFDRAKAGLSWSADGKQLFFTSASNGGTALYRLNTDTRKIDCLTSLSEGVGSFDLANGRIAFVKTTVESPFELYTIAANGTGEKCISALNSKWLANKQLSIPEKFEYRNEQGMTVEYWVMKPANFEAGKKYPVVLEIHGGPSAMWGPGESSMWHEFQYWCSRGYGVVYSNPRGSGGYGEAFLRANIRNWGDGPMRDVLGALERSIRANWIDSSRLTVTGGSYAGYLIAYLIAHDKRFKAACSQRGVYDLSTFFGEGNAWRLVPNYFGGYPWQPEIAKLLEKESPINYVANIATPYLIFHGENDLRTGVIQSEQLYKSLKVLNRPVEYVRHPGATHELTRSGNNRQRIDQLLRTWEFFERFIGPTKP